MHLKILFIVFFSMVVSSSILSQSIYQGQVLDKLGNPISFAHVFFNNDQSQGTITNEVGEFSINVSKQNLADSLVVSILGYHTLFVDYKDIDAFNNLFTLRSSSLMLDEVTILSDTYLRHLLKEAILKIPDNYPSEKYLQKAYYQNYTISDSSYSEMIEADISLVSDSYSSKKKKVELYLNQLKKTKDNRNLPDRLRSDNNKVFLVLLNDAIDKKSFSKFDGLGKESSIEEFLLSIDRSEELQLYGQYVDQGDTILTIKMTDPFFGKMRNKLFTLISINKSDLAIVKVVYGDVWASKEDFNEIVYRKIDAKYYPSYIRSVLEFEYEQNTKKHYTSHILMFYDLILGKKNIKKVKKGKKMKPEKGLRRVKMKVDETFWSNYSIPNKVSATEVLRAKIEK